MGMSRITNSSTRDLSWTIIMPLINLNMRYHWSLQPKRGSNHVKVSRVALLKVAITSRSFFIYLAFPCRETDTATGFPNYSRPFVVEEATVHNTGISLHLSTSVWVLLSPPIESRETRPTA